MPTSPSAKINVERASLRPGQSSVCECHRNYNSCHWIVTQTTKARASSTPFSPRYSSAINCVTTCPIIPQFLTYRVAPLNFEISSFVYYLYYIILSSPARRFPFPSRHYFNIWDPPPTWSSAPLYSPVESLRHYSLPNYNLVSPIDHTAWTGGYQTDKKKSKK